MDFRGEKRRLIRMAIANGVGKDNFDEYVKTIAVAAPDTLLARWKEKFFETPNIEYPDTPRLVNRFSLGADPEFAFVKRVRLEDGRYAAQYVHAERYNLTTLEAFGCDMSGRQAELRAHPSRFALRVVASLIDTLRWMNEVVAQDRLHWVANALMDGDGIGGHVHFGRRRGTLKAEISSLDVITKLLINANVLDKEGSNERASTTKYGHPGDYREQPYGYEYRTMPTWMSSPWCAYLTLVLAKLSIIEDIGNIIVKASTPKDRERVLRNLLLAYKNQDDDCRIALRALEVWGLPQHNKESFKERWGVGNALGRASTTNFFPTMINPEEKTCKELFEYLTRTVVVPFRVPTPTWEPFKLPMNVFKVGVNPHHMGLPELAQGLISKDIRFKFVSRQGNRFLLQTNVPRLCNQIELQRAARKYPTFCKNNIIVQKEDAAVLGIEDDRPVAAFTLPSSLWHDRNGANMDMVRDIKLFLTQSKMFPICKPENLKELDDIDWINPVKKKSEVPLIGRIEQHVKGEGT